ncbi:hypothetical protein [Usitatibacter palustris]|uniref:Uncharacterized protein n=1 Tax=Usitatibacter palustris TaxID=2732487 RepID=A0A6M4H3D5_9PROT|nr:hypothetical protein [Usitatibacter palustris]QJR14111.1 hypothetical protein DSM104440_00904 [Usitatibacter palustris]
MNVNDPIDLRDPDCVPRARRRVPVWIPIALIVAVLGAASAASVFVKDTRTVAERHGTVLQNIAL